MEFKYHSSCDFRHFYAVKLSMAERNIVLIDNVR
jgi:hypothetical protein